MRWKRKRKEGGFKNQKENVKIKNKKLKEKFQN